MQRAQLGLEALQNPPAMRGVRCLNAVDEGRGPARRPSERLQKAHVAREVVAVDLGEQGQPALTDVFTYRDEALRPVVAPRWLADLATVGYEPYRFNGHGGEQP